MKRSLITAVLSVALLSGFVAYDIREARASDPACMPCIDLMKNGPISALPGDLITYEFTVKNCGNVLLGSGAYVYDPMLLTGGYIWAGNLQPGQTVTFYRDYTVPADKCGDLINRAKAIGYPDESVAACAGIPAAIDYDGHTVSVNCEVESPGTGTPGYWKNHPEAWPVSSVMIGSIIYSREDAIRIMSTAEKGDKTYTIFRALVSAKLNVLIGNNSSCISSTITSADNWMALYGPAGSKIAGDSYAWSVGEPLYLMLDNYNNGLLCAPHRE